MGVVKNLMVRIGADVRGVVSGMKTAYSSTRQATSQIRSVTAGMKQSVKDSFSGSRVSIREYWETMDRLKVSHQTEIQNTERLQDKLDQLQSTYDTLKSATAGVDLSTPLTAQIQRAEEDWRGFLNEAQRVKDALKKELSLGDNKYDAGKVASLRDDLEIMRNAASEAEMELKDLRAVAATIGTGNLSFASASGMEKLLNEIRSVQQELDVSKIKTGELGQKLQNMSVPQIIKSELKSIGAAAVSAARSGVSQLWQNVKKLPGDAVRGVASLGSRLLSIGKSAATSNTGLERMVRSIRNIGVVALGMRVFRGIFGELQGIISNYISQNEELTAVVTNMKNQLGQALEPAINAIIAAMQRLMPVIQSIASAVNAVFTSLFGKVKSTTAGIQSSTSAAKSAADDLNTYSFDQINKESDSSETSSSSQETSDLSETPAWMSSILSWIDQLKAAFQSGDWKGLGRILGDGINSVVDSIDAVDIGSKVGSFVNNLFTTLHSALSTVNFSEIGKKAGEFITSGFQKVNWNTVGETIGLVMTAIPSVVVGFIRNTDWGLVAQSLSQLISGALTNVGNWIRSVDWFRLGESIWTFVRNIDYGSIAKSLFSLLGSAIGAGVGTIWGFISEAVDSIKKYFTQKIQECGGNVAKGLLTGILEGLANIGTWIIDNIFTPFIEGFKDAFGIHSPSTVMEKQGTYLGEGLLNGFKKKWQDMLALLTSGLKTIQTRITEAWSKCSTITSQKWSDISQKFTAKVTEMRTSATEKFQSIRETISMAWADIQMNCTNAVSVITDGVVSGFNKMKVGVGNAFSTMWGNVRSWINSLIGGVEYMVNSIVKGVNRLIDGLNKIGSIGEAVGLDISISRIGSVTLPRLEYGGVITGPTKALIGEAGKEVVLPLQRHTDWMDTLVNKIQTSGNVSNSGTPLIIQILMGNRKVTEYVIKDINQITQTTGVCPIKV